MRQGGLRLYLLVGFIFLGTRESTAAPQVSEESTVEPSVVTVTATRIAEPIDQIPADISVVTGHELRSRDATELASAVSLVSGTEAPAGGDAGPSSAVPSFWGLHELDAFLLVMDEIPWGGAFNPAITTLDLNDVERIEVLKGAAPVMYGATSFVGVVHVLHYPAGQASNTVDVAVGRYGSVRGSAAFVLPQWGDYRQSLGAAGQDRGFADRREKASDGRLLYRGALNLGAGELRVDANVSIVRDVPPSPIIREGTALTTLTPLNANFNPADAAIDEDRYQLAVGYSRPTSWGSWDTLASFSRSHVDDIRAFLHPDLSGAADTQNQNRLILDDYFDTHLAGHVGGANILVGADLLYGYASQSSLNGNGAYIVPPDGSLEPPPTTQLPVNEYGHVSDRRAFAGQYTQLDFKPDANWDVTAGLRLNETRERKASSDLTVPPFTPTRVSVSQNAGRNGVRPSETIGASYRLWGDRRAGTMLYADYRNAFKPATLDFGPDYQPGVLLPETAKMYEAGVRGAAVEGRVSYQAEAFRLDFNNLVVHTDSGFLTNAAASKLEGAEFEARWRAADDLLIAINYSYHDAHFTQYQFFDAGAGAGAFVDVAGKQLPLSPRHLASGGILYTPRQGLNSTIVLAYVGRRFLDEENAAPVGGYARLDATLGYGLGRYQLSLEGTNLTDRRPPVTASEFGSESFYVLNARTLWLRLDYRRL